MSKRQVIRVSAQQKEWLLDILYSGKKDCKEDAEAYADEPAKAQPYWDDFERIKILIKKVEEGK